MFAMGKVSNLRQTRMLPTRRRGQPQGNHKQYEFRYATTITDCLKYRSHNEGYDHKKHEEGGVHPDDGFWTMDDKDINPDFRIGIY